jgi:nucleoside 2-deoxyribosyltransferase
MKIDFEITDRQKCILLTLAIIDGPMSEDALEAIVRVLSSARDTINELTRDQTRDIYELVSPLEFVEKLKEDGIAPFSKRQSFIEFLERFGGTPNLYDVVKFLHAFRRPDALKRVPFFRDQDFVDEIGTLRTAGLLERSSNNLGLTEQGRDAAQRLVEGRGLILRAASASPNKVFVACRFGDQEIDALCAEELLPACRELGVRYHRIDQSEPTTTISDAILCDLAGSRVLIADLTHARPSVYFEAGFALALGIPLLLTCRRDHFRGAEDTMKVHFDLEQFRISYWERKKDGTFTWTDGKNVTSRLNELIRTRSARLKEDKFGKT